MRGRIGGLILSSRYDSRVTSAPGRAAFMSRFATEVDPEGTLPPAERERRATAARSAHFARMAYASARARAARSRMSGATEEAAR
jgi:hypothetical protein